MTNNEVIVCKFGGSSIVDESDIDRISRIFEDDYRRRIVVVSAPGKRGQYKTKVTDMLINLANERDKTKAEEKIKEIIDRYSPLVKDVSLNDIHWNLRERWDSFEEENYLKYLDRIKAFGEEACARVISKRSKRFRFIDSRELFLVSDDYSNARILPESRNRIRNTLEDILRNSNDVIIVPGFYGMTQDGNIATFSRGGSDLTGAYIASVIGAILYENFTDRDGVCEADPNIVNNPRKIERITFNEMRDLSYSGFNVLHHESVLPCQLSGVPIHVRGTFSYPKTGSYVVTQRITDPKKPIIGVSYKKGFSLYSVSRPGLDDTIGVMSDLLGVFKEAGAQIAFPSNGVDDITIVFNSSNLTGIDSLGRIEKRVREVISDPYNPENSFRINYQDNIGVLAVAGSGLHRHIGRIDSEIRDLLESNGIDVHSSSQGQEKRCLMYSIDDEKSIRAVNLIYDRFLSL